MEMPESGRVWENVEEEDWEREADEFAKIIKGIKARPREGGEAKGAEGGKQRAKAKIAEAAAAAAEDNSSSSDTSTGVRVLVGKGKRVEERRASRGKGTGRKRFDSDL